MVGLCLWWAVINPVEAWWSQTKKNLKPWFDQSIDFSMKGKEMMMQLLIVSRFEFSVLRDKLSLAIHNKITENLYTNNFDGTIAVYTTVIEQKPGFFYAYVGRGELKNGKVI